MLQAFVYDSEWWTFTWSARFMLPIIPFWIICLFPVVEMIFNKKNKLLYILVILFLLFGFFLQMGAVLISDADYSQFLWETYHFRLSEVRIDHIEAVPAIGHWLVLFRGVPMDVAWSRGLTAHTFSGLISIMVILLISGFWVWIYIHNKKIKSFKFTIIGVTIASSIFLSLITLLVYQDDPIYVNSQKAYSATLKFLKENIKPNEQVLIDSYNRPLWYFYFNFGFPQTPWIGLPPERYSINQKYIFYPAITETKKFIDQERKYFQNTWLITEKKDTPIQNGYKEELINEGYKVNLDKIFFQAGEWAIVNVVKFE